MIGLLVVGALVLVVFGVTHYKSISKEKAILQCAYGNADIYHVLENPHDYRHLKALFSKANTFSERYFISVSISRLFPIEKIERWIDDEPDSADALLCYGARLLQLAWEARGYGRGFQVNEKRWALCYERLDKREKYCLSVQKNIQKTQPRGLI